MAAAASSVPPIAVSIDQSLYSLKDTTVVPGSKVSIFRMLGSLVSSVLTSGTIVKVAVATLCAALVLSLLMKSSSGGLAGAIRGLYYSVSNRVQAVADAVRARSEPEGVPMQFDEAENEGWGVCTLRSKRRLGTTSFVQYDFELPEPDNVLPLEMGQQIDMCCLDGDEGIVTGSFYPYQPERRAKIGSFSVLAPNPTPGDDGGEEDANDTANFVRVLRGDLKVGDEVALKPGATKLSYKGEYMPITDMVYVAYGTGIVPVLEQARAVLPNGASSVKSVSVAWINSETKDFDINADLLEKEYFRYSNKMAVSCIVEDLDRRDMSDSLEINSSIPDFRPGTMAVVAGGPATFVEKAVEFLEDRGYPSDTICVL